MPSSQQRKPAGQSPVETRVEAVGVHSGAQVAYTQKSDVSVQLPYASAPVEQAPPMVFAGASSRGAPLQPTVVAGAFVAHGSVGPVSG